MPVDVTENTIRVRVRDPGDFQEGSFRTITISESDGIQAVIGKLKGETSTTVQTYIFDKEKWDKERAIAWVEEHKGKKAIKSLDDPRLVVIDQEAMKFAGSPKNRYGTHSSAGFKGNYLAAWHCHFSKLRDIGPIMGTVRRCEMIAAAMVPKCSLPSTDNISASSKPSDSCTFPGGPSDYGLSRWDKPEGEEEREKAALSCKDLAVIKRAALGEIKRRAKEREEKEKKTVFSSNIKAVGDWELDVLAVPYGGPDRGRDLQGEYFSKDTNLYLDKFDKPIVSYYHGFDPEGHPQGEPEEIGQVLSMERKNDGVWVRVLLDKTSQYAKRIWEAAKEGLARASSGTIEHIRRVSRSGLITHWPFVELALLDTGGDRRPANSYAVALPVMKAAYKQAGKGWPEIQDPEVEAEAERQSAEADLELFRVQARAREYLLGE